MGAAGAVRARETYEWKIIYQRYQFLWEELAERRRADPDLIGISKLITRPDRPDPFAAFASYPTSQISGDHRVTLRDDAQHLSQRRQLAMNSFAHSVQLSDAESAEIFNLLKERRTQTVAELVSYFKPERRPYVVRGLVWLAKMEAVLIVP
jgi:hypothetical protein